MLINTTHGEMDEALLVKRSSEFENEDELTTAIEYCLKGCDGLAHRTNQADSVSHFCSQHVHRSVHVMLKKNVAAEGVAAMFV